MSKFVKYMFGVAVIATTGFLGQNVALAGGGFSASCPDYDITKLKNGLYLDATCSAKNQSLVYNHLPLNAHIGNNNGNLVWQKNGDFSASVYGCHLAGVTGGVLDCVAFRRDKFYNITSINLDDEIANYDGHLTVLDGF